MCYTFYDVCFLVRLFLVWAKAQLFLTSQDDLSVRSFIEQLMHVMGAYVDLIAVRENNIISWKESL